MARISNAVAFSEDEPTCPTCRGVRWVSREADFLVFYKKALQSVVEEPEQVRPILRMILRREKAALEPVDG